jgi:hypothetical protein
VKLLTTRNCKFYCWYRYKASLALLRRQVHLHRVQLQVPFSLGLVRTERTSERRLFEAFVFDVVLERSLVLVMASAHRAGERC